MRHVQIKQPGTLAVVESSAPVPVGTQVVVHAEMVGICHSDIEVIDGHFITPVDYPLTPGHEWVGRIAALGPEASGFKVGDRVVGDCRVGANDYFGLNLDGAASELFLADESWLYPVPDGFSAHSAALIEPFTVGYYAISVHGPLEPGSRVLVLGGGPIGLCATAAAAGLGAEVITVDPLETRRALARRLGAKTTFAPGADLAALVREATGGRGADLVIEASGASPALAAALELVRQFGQITYVGFNIGQQVVSELGLIQSKDLTVRGITGSPGVWPAAIDLIESAHIDLTPLVTSVFPLSDAVSAYERVRTGGDVKVHLSFT
jgi:L-iditol 2-dehydrogenase